MDSESEPKQQNKQDDKKNGDNAKNQGGIKNSKIKELIEKIPFKNRKFQIITGVVILIIAVLIIVVCVCKPDYKKADLSEKTIAEACSVAREHGWKVDEPISDNNNGKYTHDIDCDNIYATVSSYQYDNEEHTVSLTFNSNIDVVGKEIGEALQLLKNSGYKSDLLKVLRCSSTGCSSATELNNGDYDSSEKVKRVNEAPTNFMLMLESKESENEENASSTSNAASASSTSSSASNSASSSSSTSIEWKQLLKDYEAWVDKYVAFMKKYKNASASDVASMMSDYSTLMSEMTSWTEKTKNMQGKLSGSDLTEYLNTLSSITQKLSSI